jgi:hypothetical protein
MKEDLEAYLDCALWTSEIDKTDKWFSEEALNKARKELRDFQFKADTLLDEWTPQEIGHNFWLTRNGHGTGFWDRDKPNGKELTAIAESFGESYIYESQSELELY